VGAVSLAAGLLLGGGGLGLIELGPRSDVVGVLAVVALVVILFRDGVEVEVEMLQREWRLPLRKLALAMPITCVLVACLAKALTDLDWTQSFLIGALLSPTDPVLSSSVVTNPRVPRVIRHSLNLESGLNDGLALPAVLAFAYALDPGRTDFVWWQFVLQDLTLGLAIGLAAGFAASRLPGRALPIAAALATYLLADAVHGNGLIAIFVAAITLGIRRDDIRRLVDRRSEPVIQTVKLGIFFVFGLVLTLDGLFDDGGAAVAIVVFTLLLARPLAVFVALLGTRTDALTRLFMGWFGPKGVATMSFSLLVLGEGIADGERIFNIAALAVVVSIVAHGLTDRPGADLIATHSERASA
jgi:NhaP-type Na+/H+ or K+/H+ antiporter